MTAISSGSAIQKCKEQVKHLENEFSTSDIVSFMLFLVKKIWLIMLLISFLFLVISNGIF